MAKRYCFPPSSRHETEALNINKNAMTRTAVIQARRYRITCSACDLSGIHRRRATPCPSFREFLTPLDPKTLCDFQCSFQFRAVDFYSQYISASPDLKMHHDLQFCERAFERSSSHHVSDLNPLNMKLLSVPFTPSTLSPSVRISRTLPSGGRSSRATRRS